MARARGQAAEDLDREALLALFWSCGGPRWRKNGGWINNDADLSTWEGVQLNDRGRVARLDLSRKSLKGMIPAVIGHLEDLMFLNLSHNELTGSIPSTVGKLTKLTYLDLRSNQFSGTIPADICRLKELSKVDLSCNQIEGTIPPSLSGCDALMLCWLEKNKIEGPIPDELALIEHLTDLDLSENQLTEGRLQGQGLRAWKEASIMRLRNGPRGSTCHSPAPLDNAAIVNLLTERQKDIEAVRAEKEQLRKENKLLQEEKEGLQRENDRLQEGERARLEPPGLFGGAQSTPARRPGLSTGLGQTKHNTSLTDQLAYENVRAPKV